MKALAALSLLALIVGCAQAPPPEESAAPAAEGLENGSFTAELNGHTVHYEVRGAGPVLMTVPNSWGLSLDGLRNLYRPLEEHVTMVYFDPRGIGGSGPVEVPEDMGMAAVREDFHALREHLGLERVHAIGWSNGAMNLILLAAERPDTLSSAIFVHGAASFTEEDMARFGSEHPELMERWARHQRALADEALSDAERTDLMKEFWLGEYFPAASAEPESTAVALRAAFGPADFSWPHARYAEQEAPVFDARDRLAEIPVRSLVIAGVADLMPPERVGELAEGLPDAEMVVFDASGHFSQVEEPERFVEVVTGFLGSAG